MSYIYEVKIEIDKIESIKDNTLSHAEIINICRKYSDIYIAIEYMSNKKA